MAVTSGSHEQATQPSERHKELFLHSGFQVQREPLELRQSACMMEERERGSALECVVCVQACVLVFLVTIKITYPVNHPHTIKRTPYIFTL